MILFHQDLILFLHPKLQTILSRKEATNSNLGENLTQVRPHNVLCSKKNEKILSNGTRKMRDIKSLSNLEFEELKEFMDLGFLF